MSAQSVPLRSLGKNGPKVPALGFGLMGLSAAYGEVPSDEERFALLDRALELGSTFWDTADLYGDSEELIGKWFKRTGKRDQIFLATKGGHIPKDNSFPVDSSAEYCKKACAKSLSVLGIDCIDLCPGQVADFVVQQDYQHGVNPETPIEETMRAMAQLKTEGKIKHVGLSNVSSATLRRACKIAPVAALQMEYSPFMLDIEGPISTDILDTCRELGVTLIAYSPLGRGLITSTFANNEYVCDAKDLRETYFPRFAKANRDKNVQAISRFKALAEKKGCSTSQLSIAWILKQGDDIIPNPGTKKIKYLEDNWGALNVHLTDEDLTEVRKLAETAGMVGGSLPPAFADRRAANTREES